MANWRELAVLSSALSAALLVEGAPGRESAPAPSRSATLSAARPDPREYFASGSEHGLRAHNRAHDLQIHFESSGIRVVDPTQDGKQLAELRLSRMGREDEALGAVPPGEVAGEGPRVEIRRPGLTEWYLNTPAGLEQGFTLEARPAAAGALVLELGVVGAEAAAAGDAVMLASVAGRRLDYGGLAVFDAAGVRQPARFEVLRADRIRIIVDDTGAAYPLVIDPLLTGEGFAAAVMDVATGSFAAAGDVNGDGYDDALAFGYDAAGSATFVFHGGPAGIGNVGPADAATRLGVGFDVAAGAGDVNGDGYDDVLVRTSGSVLLFHGGASGIASGGASGAAATLTVSHDFARGAGDVNGDGYDDVVVGRWDAAYIFHGSASGVPSGDESDANTQLVPLTDDAFLEAAPAGDVDGDGYGDLLLRAERPNDVNTVGVVFVFSGSSSGIPDGDASAATELEPATDSYPYDAALSSFESMAGAGDVNADGYDDVIVGDPANDAWGAAFLFLGSAAGIPDGGPSTASSGLRFLQEGATFGQDVDGAGDVNGDGYADVVVSVSGYDGGQANEGAVFIFLGGEDGIPIVPYVPVRLESNQADSSWFWAGVCVAGAGDVNGDGYDDVMGGASDGPVFVFHGLTCGNGVDDDGDGRTDFPADSGCSQAADLSERGGQLCDDGRDNDGDTFTDFPGDPGCSKGNDTSEQSNLSCDNGLDDDGDGRRDFPSDPGCESPADTSERGALACDNGADDDGDTFADFPADRGCSGPADSSERGNQICDDGIDNDLDGLVDYPTDGGCRSVADLSEGISACDNGLDDDGDGLTDLGADPGCSGVADNSERGAIACDNGLDDNQNGLSDYPEDPGCLRPSDGSEEAIYDDGGSHVIDTSIPGDVTARSVWRCSCTFFGCGCGYDTTSLSISEGGAVGGQVWLSGPSSVEIAGGDVAGYVITYVELCPFPLFCEPGTPQITLSSGRIGGWIEATDASVDLGGGVVDGGIWATGESSVELAGTEIAGGLDVEGNTRAHIRAGSIGGDALAHGAAQLAMVGGQVGGSLQAHDTAQVVVTGGTVWGGLVTRDEAFVRVSGGRLEGTLVLADQSVIEIVGQVAGLTGELVTATTGTLVGTLADGSPFSMSFLRNPSSILRVTGKRTGHVIDDFESGPFGISTYDQSLDVEQWILPAGSTIGGTRSGRVDLGCCLSAQMSVYGGQLRVVGYSGTPRRNPYALGTVRYDGTPDGVFDGSSGQLFADLTGAGSFDRFEVQAPSSVGITITVFDRDSTASASSSVPNSVPFSAFTGIDFTDVRALSIVVTAGLGGTVVDGVSLAGAPIVACDNGLDDDGDGRSDLLDPGCADSNDASERGSAVCDDALDNDGDGRADHGQGLQSDPGCASLFDPSELGAIACDNGGDDDADTRIDWRGDGTGDDGCFSLQDPDETAEASCGFGPELALLIPLLTALRRRFRVPEHRAGAWNGPREVSRMGRTSRLWVLVAAFAVAPAVASGQGLVLRDGTLGSGPLEVGPGTDPLSQPATYLITPELGEQQGANLFHSFARFDVGSEETATFTGPDPIDAPQSVSHIISRVTGGDPSEIDGTLRSTIPGADVWLLNPSGVVFGEGASLDVPGSFHAGTGGSLGFEGTLERFYGDPSRPSVLATARPEAFGFLGNADAEPISVTGARLDVRPGETIELAGGDVTLTAATLDAPGGAVSIRGGRIVVAGGSKVLGENAGEGAAGNVTVAASASVDVNNSLLSVNTTSSGNAGTIRIVSRVITFRNGPGLPIDDPSRDPAPTEVGVSAETRGGGAGGRIEIQADALTLRDGVSLSAQTLGLGATGDAGTIDISAGSVDVSARSVIWAGALRSQGDAGVIEIDAGTLRLDGAEGYANVWTSSQDAVSDLDSPALSVPGAPGRIEVTARAVEIVNGGRIDSNCVDCDSKRESRSPEAASVQIVADSLVVGGTDPQGNFSGVFAMTFWGAGDAGTILVDVRDRLEIFRGGELVALTRGSSGDAGHIQVDADSVLIREPAPLGTGIFVGSHNTSRGSQGNAGSIDVTARTVAIEPGGIIDASSAPVEAVSEPGGDAGTIRVSATESISVSNESGRRFSLASVLLPFLFPDRVAPTGIHAATLFGGEGGSVTLEAPEITISHGAIVGSSTVGGLAGGSVDLRGENIRVVDGGGVSGVSLRFQRAGGDAGDVTLTATESIQVAGAHPVFGDRSSVTSSTLSSGAAGTLTLEAPRILIEDGGRVATTALPASGRRGEGGARGDVTLDADQVIVRSGGRIDASSFVGEPAGDIHVTARESIAVAGAGSGIASRTGGPGDGGSVALHAPRIEIAEGGEVSARSAPADADYDGLSLGLLEAEGLVADPPVRARGDAGNLTLTANEVLLLGGALATNATDEDAADGGEIAVEAREWVHLDAGEITASVNGGAGGNITIDPEVMLLENDSRIVARAFGGSGGRIVIDADNYFAFPGTEVSAEADRQELSGTVEVSTPGVNLAGTLAALPTSYLDAQSLMKAPCAARRSGERAGTFAVRAHDGIPPEPDGWLPAMVAFDATSGTTAALAPPHSAGGPPLLASGSCR